MADLELNSIGNGDGNNYLLRDNSKIPLSGSNQISGDLVPATDNSYNLGSSSFNFNTIYCSHIKIRASENIACATNDSYFNLYGGTGYLYGASISLTGKDSSTQGRFTITTYDGTNGYSLIGSPNGTLSWSGRRISSNSNSDELNIDGGTGYTNGATLWLTGKNNSNYSGYFTLIAHNGTNECQLQGGPNGTLSWAGSLFQTANLNLKDTVPTISLFNNSASSATSFIADTGTSSYSTLEFNLWNSYAYKKFVLFPSSFFSTSGATLGRGSDLWGQIYSTNSAISTSDERQKDNIKQIDDKLLQAWGNVNIVQFNFKDALEKKGENARLHTGYIAQNIQQACEESGVNPNDYGLFCHDSWEEQEEKKDENGQVIEPYRAKGDLYSLRYEEALVVECAYLRRENAKLKEQLQRHEDYLKLVEEHLHLKNL